MNTSVSFYGKHELPGCPQSFEQPKFSFGLTSVFGLHVYMVTLTQSFNPFRNIHVKNAAFREAIFNLQPSCEGAGCLLTPCPFNKKIHVLTIGCFCLII